MTNAMPTITCASAKLASADTSKSFPSTGATVSCLYFCSSVARSLQEVRYSIDPRFFLKPCAGGVGGGGIFVPILIILGGFITKEAVPISNALIGALLPVLDVFDYHPSGSFYCKLLATLSAPSPTCCASAHLL